MYTAIEFTVKRAYNKVTYTVFVVLSLSRASYRIFASTFLHTEHVTMHSY